MRPGSGFLTLIGGFYRTRVRRRRRHQREHCRREAARLRAEEAQRRQSREAEAALQQYGILITYLVYENTHYWQRFYLFLVSSSILLGAVLSRESADVAAKNVELLVAFSWLAAVGAYIGVLCYRVLISADWWITRWVDRLRELEPLAFGRMAVLRRGEGTGPAPSIKNAARHTVNVFQTIWLAHGVYFYCLAFCLSFRTGDPWMLLLTGVPLSITLLLIRDTIYLARREEVAQDPAHIAL